MSYKIILASGSPRRRELMQQLGLNFTVRTVPVAEDYPATLAIEKVAEYLAKKKARASQSRMAEDELVITADTTVVVGDQLLNKPADAAEAQQMLRMLSGKVHRVITGVGIAQASSMLTFSDTTQVYFRALAEEEIHFYVAHYQPYDKAGGYAIQEWIGMVGIERIDGSYFNVVGLPVEKLYRELRSFVPLPN